MNPCPTCDFENEDSAQQCAGCRAPLPGLSQKDALPPAATVEQALVTDQSKRQPREPDTDSQGSPEKANRPGRPSGGAGLKTIIEGLNYVTEPTRKTAPMTQSLRAITDENAIVRAPPPERRPPKEPQARRPQTVTILVLLILIIFVGAMAGALATRDSGVAEGVNPAVEPGWVPVEGGPYLRGLANDYRLFFGKTCKKINDDPDTGCKEEIALKGEYPQESINVPAFEIDRLEASNGEWRRCVEAGACPEIDTKTCANWTIRGKVPFLRVPKELLDDEMPVVCVSNAEAKAYCAWAKGRLPTADEWEKAARGVDGYTLPWGTNWDPSLANWGERDMTRTAIVGKLDGYERAAPSGSFGTKSASPYGVYDMAGNVAEWVRSDDPAGKEVTARGGSWRSNPLELRVTRRLFLNPGERRTDVGLRCARTPEATSE